MTYTRHIFHLEIVIVPVDKALITRIRPHYDRWPIESADATVATTTTTSAAESIRTLYDVETVESN